MFAQQIRQKAGQLRLLLRSAMMLGCSSSGNDERTKARKALRIGATTVPRTPASIQAWEDSQLSAPSSSGWAI